MQSSLEEMDALCFFAWWRAYRAHGTPALDGHVDFATKITLMNLLWTIVDGLFTLRTAASAPRAITQGDAAAAAAAADEARERRVQ